MLGMKRSLIILLFLVVFQCTAQQWQKGNFHHKWVDSLMKTLTLQDQIAQMMMVAAWSNKGNDHVKEVEELIDKYHIGGLIFFQSDPLRQAYLTNYYQQNSKIPLFISIDGEWGLAMRLRGLEKFPFQMTLGAAGDDSLAWRTGYQIGLQCKRLGIHINFAPDVDVNTNPLNPIIGFRSFGEDVNDVGRLGNQVMLGMQKSGIIACAKHFPGHGDSKSDSHLELPHLDLDRKRLDEVELKPFEKLYKNGVMSTMIGHLEIPSIDTTPHRPSSLSPIVIKGILKKELGFKGLIFTDALNMKGVAKYYAPGYAEAAAAEAGNDILVYPENVPLAISLITKMVREGKIDSLELAERVRKILYFKVLAGLHHYQAINTETLLANLSNAPAEKLARETSQKAVTVIVDKGEWLPLAQHTKRKIALWSIGKAGYYSFGYYLQRYHKVDEFFTYRDSGYDVFGKMADSLIKNYDEIIISIHDQNLWGKKSQFLPQQMVQNIYKVAEVKPTILVSYGNLYLLKNLPNLACVIQAYEDDAIYQKTSSEIIFGERPSLGKLPATAFKGYELGMGEFTESRMVQHFEMVNPKEAGFGRDFGKDLDSLVSETRRIGAAPGGQLMVLKGGKAVYHKAWGSFYYDSLRPVKRGDLYDLASITKVAATTLCIMKLHEQGKLHLDWHLHNYLPETKGTNKEKIPIRQLLTHEAGLLPFIPFYKTAMQKPGVLVKNKDSIHQIQISKNMWMDSGYSKTIWNEILQSELKNKGEFVYSDLSMILAAEVVKRITGKDVYTYAFENFYSPLRLTRLAYLPLETWYENNIAPSSVDNYWRMDTITGFVHDPSAAMLGGVAGNAGLFSNAEDLGKIFQMLNNGGTLDGKKYFKPSTVKEFTERANKKTHRGLGFDKPNGKTGGKANVSELVPLEAYGHSGFTGTWVWADPKNDIVFVFLSNRTFPNENNKKLIEYNIRTRAIEIVYKAL